MDNRPVLIHYHIFKNAGCSVDASLKASFGDAWAGFEGVHAHDILSARQFAEFLRANEHVRAVSSHLARPPLPWNGCLPVVFLRHPLLRARSVYEFTRRDPSQPFADIARGGDFKDYVRWALRRERGSIVIRNYQVVHLSDASWRCADILDAEAEPRDLEQASRLLTSWGIAGIVESFALSAKLFQKNYGPVLPGLEFMDRHEHATVRHEGSIEDQIARVAEMLDETLYEEFMALNALDLALYTHAKRILDRAADSCG